MDIQVFPCLQDITSKRREECEIKELKFQQPSIKASYSQRFQKEDRQFPPRTIVYLLKSQCYNWIHCQY